MRMISRHANLIALMLVFSVSIVYADIVNLNDGSVIKGKITETKDGKFKVETAVAGVVSVNVDSVDSVSTDSDVYVAFDNDNTVFGRLVHERGRTKIRTSNGELNVGKERVLAIWHLGQRNPLLPQLLERKWKYEAAFDLAGKTGNAEKITTAGHLKATMATDQDKLVLYLRGERSKNEGVKSVDEVVGGIDYESKFYAPHSWYARGELEDDRIEELEIRATAAVGYGYYVFNEEAHELRCRIGFQVRHESFEDTKDAMGNRVSGESETSPAIDLGLYHRYHIQDWGKLITDINYAPSLEDSDNYRIYHTSTLEIPLANSDAWKIQFGIANEYNNLVAKGRDRLDLTYFSRLVLNWQ